jgi:hypothetical protein
MRSRTSAERIGLSDDDRARLNTLACFSEKCMHHAPMALVPLMIRWGAETSSDRLRQRTKRGHRGATSQHPGWVGTTTIQICCSSGTPPP